MSTIICYLHIVFATKNRESTLTPTNAPILYRFIWRMLIDQKCTLLRINGMPDHIHMLIQMNPAIKIGDLMRKIKAESSGYIRSEGIFPLFNGWGKGYFATSISHRDRGGVIEYIKHQHTHHAGEDFANELARFYSALGLELYPGDML